MPLRIATLNVHGWQDARFDDNVDRVSALLHNEQVDVVGLQEAKSPPLPELAERLGMSVTQNQYGCVLMSRYPIVAQDVIPMRLGRGRRAHTQRHRAIWATVSVGGEDVRLVVVHLDHIKEPTRLKQLDAIEYVLSGLPPAPTLWLGDFNALRADDYTRKQWIRIAQVREANRWEAPHTALTDRMRAASRRDCWVSAGRKGPLATCRFDTRIDYLWAEPALLQRWVLTRCRAIESDASDHRMVVGVFEERS